MEHREVLKHGGACKGQSTTSSVGSSGVGADRARLRLRAPDWRSRLADFPPRERCGDFGAEADSLNLEAPAEAGRAEDFAADAGRRLSPPVCVAELPADADRGRPDMPRLPSKAG